MQVNEAIRVENLSKNFRKFNLSDISFSLDKGFIMGIIGRNGAGKTTLMKLLYGVYTKSQGEVYIDGKRFYKKDYKVRQRIGYIAEEDRFLLEKTLLENAKAFGSLYDQFDVDYFKELLCKYNLDEEKTPDQLSKGMKIKFQLAFVLANHPKLLLLDEPTGGLDPIFRQEFLGILQGLVEEENMGVIISTHITTDLDKIADYIMILDKGKMISLSTKEELMDEYRLIKGPREILRSLPKEIFISVKSTNSGFEGLAHHSKKIAGQEEWLHKIVIENPDLSDILYYLTQTSYPKISGSS
ncbi:ABC-2 type transport system ATP-binding protein [Anaerosporobacter mobilis DSM 15930]|uniref:ABC-2 type transport system ATP-binding protein n=1 Tax=Anaerosporobacter mobilis DSM 15930 TaxID=1120996 RepID=A0A1M7KTD9_9FIRM|nr:ABC transporter ATP-binding protein [Anaerosporobacter mobilis]SHM68825.1 ABC-2 type transport system ATP-binding protein [Anaerosporobacter mobilis DSM 15930]